jgi:hypothetical protein
VIRHRAETRVRTALLLTISPAGLASRALWPTWLANAIPRSVFKWRSYFGRNRAARR